MGKYKIHFVCRGNIYRSRIAEAWANEANNKSIEATSSGIAIADNPHLSISPWAHYATRKVKIEDKLSKDKIQTTAMLLDEADIIIFMNTDVYADATKSYAFNPLKCVVWNIEDMGVCLEATGKEPADTVASQHIALDTSATIQGKVTELIHELTLVSWADIVDEQNLELGFRLPISWANDKGLWRRSCHAVILTAENKFIVEKRSKKIIFSPSHLDITLGGAVDAGETPKMAIVREIHEELGLYVEPSKLALIDVYKWNSYHPHYKKYTKCFLYTYCTRLNTAVPVLNIQKSELAKAQVISSKNIDKLLRIHHLINFGRLSSGYKYYEKVVGLARSHYKD